MGALTIPSMLETQILLKTSTTAWLLLLEVLLTSLRCQLIWDLLVSKCYNNSNYKGLSQMKVSVNNLTLRFSMSKKPSLLSTLIALIQSFLQMYKLGELR
jgi:hypothetical protein